MTDILKLAEQAGIPFNKYGLVGCETCETDIDDALQRFAELIRADYKSELIGASVEPVAYLRTDGKHVVLAEDRKNYPKSETRFSIPLFTAEALAARVAQVEKDAIERCAKVCDEVAAKYQREHYATAENVADECAAAIRADHEYYPAWVCSLCGAKYGRRRCGMACWHAGTCGICGIEASVTEPRDFGHLQTGWRDRYEQEASNAKVSGAGTASAGLPGYAAGGNGERK